MLTRLRSQQLAWGVCQALWEGQAPQSLCRPSSVACSQGQYSKDKKRVSLPCKPASCTGKAVPWDQTYFFLISTRLEWFNLPYPPKKCSDSQAAPFKSQVSVWPGLFSLWRRGTETICPFCIEMWRPDTECLRVCSVREAAASGCGEETVQKAFTFQA